MAREEPERPSLLGHGELNPVNQHGTLEVDPSPAEP